LLSFIFVLLFFFSLFLFVILQIHEFYGLNGFWVCICKLNSFLDEFTHLYSLQPIFLLQTLGLGFLTSKLVPNQTNLQPKIMRDYWTLLALTVVKIDVNECFDSISQSIVIWSIFWYFRVSFFQLNGFYLCLGSWSFCSFTCWSTTHWLVYRTCQNLLDV